MNALRLLQILVGAELICCASLFGLRLNATLPKPPPVDDYTDAVTGREILAVPGRFLFDSALKWRTLGKTYMQARFFAAAEPCLRKAADLDPRADDIGLWHGCCLEQLGNLDAARAAYERTARTGSARVAELAWYRIGRIALQLEQADAAASAFEKAGDNHAPSVYQRAKLMIRGDSAAAAAPLLERLLEDYPGDLHVWQLKARWAAALGRPEEAAVARDTVLRSGHPLRLEEPAGTMVPAGESFNGLYRQMLPFMQPPHEGGTQSAAEHLLTFVRDETRWQNKIPLLLEDVAEVQIEAGNLTTARDLLVKQIEKLGRPTKKTWELLAKVELAENHLPEAWRDWKRAELLRPIGVDHEQMALLAQKLGDAYSARRHRGLARQCAAISSFLNDRLDDVRAASREAIEIDPELPHAWYYLGESERLLGDAKAAKVAFRRCLELMPYHGRARASLMRLEPRGSY